MTDSPTNIANVTDTINYVSTPDDSAPVAITHRVRRAMLTWVFGAAYTVTTLLIGFLITPALLRYLGDTQIGAARAMGEWNGYLTVADLGLGAAIGVFLVRAWGSGLKSNVIGVAKRAMGIYLWLMLLIVPVGICLAWNMPRLVIVPPNMTSELRIAAFVSLITIVVYPLAVFRSVLETAQRGYLVHAALLVQALAVAFGSLFLAKIGWGLIGQMLALSIGALFFSTLVGFWSLRELHGRKALRPGK